MRLWILGAVVLALAACDGREAAAPKASAPEATPPVSAAQPTAEQVREAVKQAMPEAVKQASESVRSCLELVQAARFQDAVPACTQALGEDPGNPEVKQALERAQTEVAKSKLGGLP